MGVLFSMYNVVTRDPFLINALLNFWSHAVKAKKHEPFLAGIISRFLFLWFLVTGFDFGVGVQCRDRRQHCVVCQMLFYCTTCVLSHHNEDFALMHIMCFHASRWGNSLTRLRMLSQHPSCAYRWQVMDWIGGYWDKLCYVLDWRLWMENPWAQKPSFEYL